MSVAWSNGHGGSIVAHQEWKGLLKTLGARKISLRNGALKAKSKARDCQDTCPSSSIRATMSLLPILSTMNETEHLAFVLSCLCIHLY